MCVCVLDNEDSHDFAERSEDSRGNLNESKNGKKEGWGFKMSLFLSVLLALTRVCRRFVALRYRHYVDGSSFSRVLRRFNWEQAISLVTR